MIDTTLVVVILSIIIAAIFYFIADRGANAMWEKTVNDLKFENRRLHAQVRQMRTERNKLALELIRHKNFKQRFVALVKSKRKSNDPET